MKPLWFQDRHAWRLILLGYLSWLAVLNLAWEAAHVRLYTLWYEAGPAHISFSVLHCTLGDVLIGLAYTMFSEWMNITWLRSWTYAESMPTLELAGFEFGLTPLAQWLIVPPLALYLARKIQKWRSKTPLSQARSWPMR